MTPKFLAVLEMAIEQGIDYGINKFYKHRDDTPPQNLGESLSEHVMNSIYEWFELGENE